MSTFWTLCLRYAILAFTVAISTCSPAAVVRVVTEEVGNQLDLVEIEVTSGATSWLPNRIIPFEGLIPTTIADYVSVSESNASNTVTVLATPGPSPPVGDHRLRLLGDRHISTGIFNPSYGSPGVQVTFDTPVINGPGVDVVLFELTIGIGQTPDPIEMLLPGRPDRTFRVRSAEYQLQGAIPVSAAPMTFAATVGSGGSATLSDLRDATLDVVGVTSNHWWHAIAIDFDEIGIPPWHAVPILEILSDNAARNTPVDLLMVLGLPPVTHAADFDRDLDVTLSDYSRWAADYGGSGVSDGNGDGSIDAADYTIWRDAFDALKSRSAPAVPEPVASLLVTVAVTVIVAHSTGTCTRESGTKCK